MGSPFDALDAEMSAVVGDAYGETVHVIPRRTGQYSAPGTDVDRPPIAATGVLSMSPNVENVFGSNISSSQRSRIGVADSEVWFSKAQAVSMGYKIQRGDRISFPGRDDESRFAVVAVLTTELGDVRAMVVKEDAE